ncbi:helicase HerA-like domain-containing protein [Tropicimonas sp. IMCC34011]|uniref:helicase HerA-like domain-containing protein n=1 Tax=Tropicimonas sp. IMCC34011 TaxID=2248759 RepID=UPI000E28474C|nr:helicase HerA-like domain-containing protein [Tropicimonas sp. IMCC34011]
MDERGTIFVGGGGEGYGSPQFLELNKANRHGLIAGATGTGKTVTLQILAESFSAAGVPVFVSDIKGDLSGLAAAGSAEAKHHDAFAERAATIGLDLDYSAFPVTFWDLFGEKGHPVRTTIADMGPLLLSRLLDLSEAQEGVLNVAFRVADEQGLALLDLKDLQALLTWTGEQRKELSLRYGNVSTASVGAIQRALLVLENEGGDRLFGEPALEIRDLFRTAEDGRGQINLLAADRLVNSPRLYATFLLWLLSELFEMLPEIGDPDKPRLVFFFDEAHLLFDDAPKALLDKVEQVARLIRSKGVGVYFCTQTPADVPDDVLGQLGNRVQHALRAFTERDRRALNAAAGTYRDNPALDIAEAISEVGTGEAVTSFLADTGEPGMAERTLIRPPSSRLGPIGDDERAAIVAASPLAGRYDAHVDRESAFEILTERAETAKKRAMEAEDAAEEEHDYNAARRYSGPLVGRSGEERKSTRTDGIGTAFAKSFARQLGTQSSRMIVRGLLGGMFRGR